MLHQQNPNTRPSSLGKKHSAVGRKSIKSKERQKKESDKSSDIMLEYSPKTMSTTAELSDKSSTLEGTLTSTMETVVYGSKVQETSVTGEEKQDLPKTKESIPAIDMAPLNKGLPFFPMEQVMKATIAESNGNSVEDVLLIDKEFEEDTGVIVAPEASPETAIKPEDPIALPSAMLAVANGNSIDVSVKSLKNERINNTDRLVVDETECIKQKPGCLCFFGRRKK